MMPNNTEMEADIARLRQMETDARAQVLLRGNDKRISTIYAAIAREARSLADKIENLLTLNR